MSSKDTFMYRGEAEVLEVLREYWEGAKEVVAKRVCRFQEKI